MGKEFITKISRDEVDYEVVIFNMSMEEGIVPRVYPCSCCGKECGGESGDSVISIDGVYHCQSCAKKNSRVVGYCLEDDYPVSMFELYEVYPWEVGVYVDEQSILHPPEDVLVAYRQSKSLYNIFMNWVRSL